MAHPTLEDRVAALEKLVARFMAGPNPQAPKDWRSTIGIFGDDSIQKRIDAAGRKIREADRRRTRK